MTAPVLFWFHTDFRLGDNFALQKALESGVSVIPVFIWSEKPATYQQPGGASRSWLHHSLCSLSESLEALGASLVIRTGDTQAVLQKLIRETGVTQLFTSQAYDIADRKPFEDILQALRDSGVSVSVFNTHLLFEPGQIKTKTGTPYLVYTPFWNALHGTLGKLKPLPAPTYWPHYGGQLASQSVGDLQDLQLLSKLGWDTGFYERFTPGEAGGRQALETFLRVAGNYHEDRNRPDRAGTSRLSPHLHFGEISPRQIWAALDNVETPTAAARESLQTYRRELVWREFAYHILWHHPHTLKKALKPAYDAFPWKPNEAHLHAWQRGQTGIPIVDAAMRELWHTGWMHNRMRMVTASLLIKNMLQPWQDGVAWFWDTLVDADLANNTLGWQWVAGCGADASPFFRVFNPVTQGEKFDPKGEYVRRWVPELARLETKWLHKPWLAPPLTLHAAGITLGETYPEPIVDLAESRTEALEAFYRMRHPKPTKN